MNKVIKRIYFRLFPRWTNHLKRELSGCKTLLDLGCGRNSPVQHISVFYSLGVERYEPYLEESKKKRIHTDYMLADIRQVEFEENSFDAVLLLDVIEHLSVQEGNELLLKVQKWAKNKVVVFTPNGFNIQEGYDYNLLQIHKSGWSVDQLENLGFSVFGINGWKKLRGSRSQVKYKPTYLWMTISDLTQKITFHYPKLAFQLLATKSMLESTQR